MSFEYVHINDRIWLIVRHVLLTRKSEGQSLDINRNSFAWKAETKKGQAELWKLARAAETRARDNSYLPRNFLTLLLMRPELSADNRNLPRIFSHARLGKSLRTVICLKSYAFLRGPPAVNINNNIIIRIFLPLLLYNYKQELFYRTNVETL